MFGAKERFRTTLRLIGCLRGVELRRLERADAEPPAAFNYPRKTPVELA